MEVEDDSASLPDQEGEVDAGDREGEEEDEIPPRDEEVEDEKERKHIA